MSDDDGLNPARGVINGVIVSVILLVVIGAIVYFW